MELPVKYHDFSFMERRKIREEYIRLQNGMCFFCKASLSGSPPEDVMEKTVDWKLFPEGFMDNPIHLQHDHSSGLTEGAVHAYCNAVWWQYHGR
jgi:hypothetical protein